MSASRIRARRRWILRATISLSLSAAVLVVIVAMQRDRMAISDCLRPLNEPLALLQSQINELGQLPAQFPDAPDRLGLVYASDIVREYAREAKEPLIVAHCRPEALLLRSDGNSVVILDRGSVRAEWWPRTRFVHESLAQAARIRHWDQLRRAELPQIP